MSKRRKMSNKDKLKKWVEANPDDCLKMSYKAISKETRLSISSVYRNLCNIIAELKNCMPSEIQEIREKNGLVASAEKLPDEQIQQIKELNKTMSIQDIAFKLKRDKRTIQKYIGDNQQTQADTENK